MKKHLVFTSMSDHSPSLFKMISKSDFCFFFYLSTIICIILADQIYEPKYEHISKCHFYNAGNIFGNDNVTFICGEIDRENAVFFHNDKINCTNYVYGIGTFWPGTVDFENCHFARLNRNFFKHFPKMHSINLSYVGLESLQKEIFNEATNVSKLILSKNQLTEIPSLVFVNAKNLTSADFSENKIVYIDSFAFAGANKLQSLDLSKNELNGLDEVFNAARNLQVLNLSFNRLSLLNPRNFSTCKLLELDVSHNNITTVQEHTFDKLSELKLLNLSFNPIGDLTSDRFVYLVNLEHLNMKRTNLSVIQLGAFSHQHKLISLDLSENSMKMLDFKLFFPIQHDLVALYLSGNQLSHLNGFRNTLFPQLKLLDIKNNKFSCTYLEHFMESISWEKIRLLVDANSISPRDVNIRGIGCDATGNDESTDSTPNNSHDNVFVKVTLGFICIIMLVYLIIFLTLNHERIRSEWTKLKLIFSKTNEKTDNTVVEYFNEEPFFEKN